MRTCIACALLALLVVSVRGEVPIYKQEPHDRITLDKANESKVFDIEPLKLTRKEIDRKLKMKGNLTFRRIDVPDKTFEIPWRSIVKVETFGELILNKAVELSDNGKFDEAFDYFTYLQRNIPNVPGLDEAVDKSLQAEVVAASKNDEYDGALALLRELRRRNPEFPRIESALGKMTEKLVERYAENEDYRSARALLNALAADFPQNAVVAHWRARFRDEAAPMLAEARAAADAGRWRRAAELSRRLTNVCPDLPGARELALAVNQKYPQVIVGVGSLAADFTPGRLSGWSARRDSRLLYRTLAEFAGPSIEGGNYICPVGNIAAEDLGRKIAITLKPGIGWATGDETLSNSDVAVRLLEMAAPGNPAYRLDWSDLLGAVSTSGVYKVEVELLRAHVRPEAMMQIVLVPKNHLAPSDDPPPTNGPMTVHSENDEERVFAANQRYFAAEAGQPMEIVQRRFKTVAQAIRALKRGDIDVIDRVSPWLLPDLQDKEDVSVQPYALPLVHCLIPNLKRPFMRDRTFRRALAYGIHRDAILEQMLGGKEIPGCVSTSSPFPLSTGPNDPMGYASDTTIKPRPYEPRLSIALADVAFHLFLNSPEGKASKLKTMPTLVLAHPSDEIASGACQSIQLQLKLLGIPVELRPIAGPIPARVPDDVDLLYAELATWEPVVDARRLLGEDGMSGDCSPYMSQALRRLDEAVEWGEVRLCLHRIHQICHADVAVVPLWQIVEHFAYRDRIREMSPRPVSLFQNVEQWRLAFEYPVEK
ncbi:MAG: hypothetical protein JW959_10150 [Pirellulales bacterium]|nr:hypothetical protein [Pirellulales bacterium]